ncbi:MAG: uracil-DNA glycosylase [Clostridiales Family XIII bacterium]|jgi:uracil-DNA glycosylase|nr:uracil-DNA glycosylase [Clostridiales Family XIII bacterium]
MQTWENVIGEEFNKPYCKELQRFIGEEYRTHTIYPPKDCIFNAFNYTAYDDIKVVILGQDPYHGENQAMGLSFSVPETQRTCPPSLLNIFKELESDLGIAMPTNGDLRPWAQQGVLLLNTVLTVKAHEANSHRDVGWETFTDAAISAINEINRPIVFLLWGKPAQSKTRLLNNPNHLILEAPHPSPLSAHRGFFGCKHFSKVNDYLQLHGVEPINWAL